MHAFADFNRQVPLPPSLLDTLSDPSTCDSLLDLVMVQLDHFPFRLGVVNVGLTGFHTAPSKRRLDPWLRGAPGEAEEFDDHAFADPADSDAEEQHTCATCRACVPPWMVEAHALFHQAD